MAFGLIVNGQHMHIIIVLIEGRAHNHLSGGTPTLRDGSDGAGARAGAAGFGQADATFPRIKTQNIVALQAGEINIGAFGKSFMAFQLKAILRGQTGRAGGNKNHRMWIADIDRQRLR